MPEFLHSKLFTLLPHILPLYDSLESEDFYFYKSLPHNMGLILTTYPHIPMPKSFIISQSSPGMWSDTSST